jgi:predicted metal-binding membrane protein
MGASLVLLTLLSWLSLAVAADAMKAMTGEGGSPTYMWLVPMGRWGATEFVLGLAIWAIMMIEMMVPSASPMLFAFLRISRSHPKSASPIGLVGAFLLGYLLVWGVFSLLATATQWLLHTTVVLTPTMYCNFPEKSILTGDDMARKLLKRRCLSSTSFPKTPVLERVCCSSCYPAVAPFP